MKISIIIPVKNEIKNLQKILPLYQSLKKNFDLEIIVADGQSTDGSIDYAEKMADRVEVKKKKERETIGEGRNRGARVAQGEIFVFLDAAVIIEKPRQFFQTIEKRFTDPHIIAATTKVVIDPAVAVWQDVLVHGVVNFLLWFWNFMGWGAGKGEVQIVRRSAFRKVGGYNETLVAAEDNDLFRRLAKIGRVVFFSQLRVFDDPRRYRTEGYPRVVGKWILNQVWVKFSGRSFSREWKRID